jgi:P-type E1-E2 ATPase
MDYVLNTGKIITLSTILLDLNGTLSVNGKIVKGSKERIKKLKKMGFQLVMLSGDSRGNAKKIAKELGIECIITKSSKEKKKAIKQFNRKECIAIGNARIDIGMLKHAKISMLTLQIEGIHTGAIKYADIIVPSILDAFDIFIKPHNFRSTMKI